MHWLCAYLLAKTAPALSKWVEKRLGSSLVLRLYCVILRACSSGFWHDFLTFFFFLHFLRARKNLCYQGESVHNHSAESFHGKFSPFQLQNHLDVVHCMLLQVTCRVVPLHLDTLRFRKILWLVKRYQQQFHVNQFPSISFITWLLWRAFVTNSKHAMRDEQEVLNQTSWSHDEMKKQVPHVLPPPFQIL